MIIYFGISCFYIEKIGESFIQSQCIYFMILYNYTVIMGIL